VSRPGVEPVGDGGDFILLPASPRRPATGDGRPAGAWGAGDEPGEEDPPGTQKSKAAAGVVGGNQAGSPAGSSCRGSVAETERGGGDAAVDPSSGAGRYPQSAGLTRFLADQNRSSPNPACRREPPALRVGGLAAVERLDQRLGEWRPCRRRRERRRPKLRAHGRH